MPYESGKATYEDTLDRGDVARSIWDGSDHEPYDRDEEDERNERLSDAELEAREREREVGGGWFGGAWADMSDARWGPYGTRRYQEDPRTGQPVAQHGDSPRIKRGSVRYGGVEPARRKVHQKVRDLDRKRQAIRHPIEHKRKKVRKSFHEWFYGKPKKVYSAKRKRQWI